MPYIKPDYSYPEFKRKLTTNPKWIARGLTVLCNGEVPGVKLSQADQLSVNFMVRQLAFATGDASDRVIGGGLPWTLDSENGQDAIEFVRRFSASLYKFYLKQPSGATA